MHEHLSKFRHVSWVAVLCSLIGAVLMFFVGALETFFAVRSVVVGSFSHLTGADSATLYVIKSLDSFLIALILVVFANGIHTLFIRAPTGELPRQDAPAWSGPSSISELKNVLAEVVVIILFVKFLEAAVLRIESLDWELLVLPTSILFLSLALRFLELRPRAGVRPPAQDAE